MKYTKEEIYKSNVQHRFDVIYAMKEVNDILMDRAYSHDITKMTDTALELLTNCLNGAGDWDKWDAYHFKTEDHHPEYFGDDIVIFEDMSLFSMMEWVVDGACASYRRSKARPTWEEQYRFFITRKKVPHTIACILSNTFMETYERLEKRIKVIKND